jgi:LmbE family N-acetylglucosaminyl deacetylase
LSRTVLAVGAHIGDMDLAAGPMLAQHVLDGGHAVLLALTPGERGHPRMSPDDYKIQKIFEGRRFAAAIGAEFRVFDDRSDGFLAFDDDICLRVADVIRDVRADVVIAHWPRSIHSDHENASRIAERARFLAGLPGIERAQPRHPVGSLLYAENWEDAEGFSPTEYRLVSSAAKERWAAAIDGQAFARGETYGFRYNDYYAAQLRMRGCLAGTDFACAVASADGHRRLVEKF